MTAALHLQVVADPLPRVPADVAVTPLFAGERPLRGSAGWADWRLCGRLSELLLAQRLTGERGEAALLASFGGLVQPWLLALGCGRGETFDSIALGRFAGDAVARALALRAATAALALETRGPDVPLNEIAELLVDGAASALADRGARGPEELLLRLVLPGQNLLDATLALREAPVPVPARSVLLHVLEPGERRRRASPATRSAAPPRDH
jgi:hypothetical protein